MAASLSPVLHPFPWIDCVIILGLVALNGVFAMSELAIVSARRPRLEAMARKGSKGASRAIALGADPGRFLSTVQIGITLIGIIAGAYSGASLGGPAGERLAALGIRPDWAETLGFAIVIGFLVAMDSGISVPERIVFMQSWGADRTAEDAIRDREEAMDRLRAEVAANRRALEQQQAREKALAAERAAARQATS